MFASILLQTVATLFINMPLELTPYLTLNQKKEMIECWNAEVDTATMNKLRGMSTIDTLTDDYGRFILSSSCDLQLIKEGDTLCIIETFRAPAEQSVIRRYDADWNLLSKETTELELEEVIKETKNDFKR